MEGAPPSRASGAPPGGTPNMRVALCLCARVGCSSPRPRFLLPWQAARGTSPPMPLREYSMKRASWVGVPAGHTSPPTAPHGLLAAPVLRSVPRAPVHFASPAPRCRRLVSTRYAPPSRWDRGPQWRSRRSLSTSPLASSGSGAWPPRRSWWSRCPSTHASHWHSCLTGMACALRRSARFLENRRGCAAPTPLALRGPCSPASSRPGRATRRSPSAIWLGPRAWAGVPASTWWPLPSAACLIMSGLRQGRGSGGIRSGNTIDYLHFTVFNATPPDYSTPNTAEVQRSSIERNVP